MNTSDCIICGKHFIRPHRSRTNVCSKACAREKGRRIHRAYRNRQRQKPDPGTGAFTGSVPLPTLACLRRMGEPPRGSDDLLDLLKNKEVLSWE